MFATVFPLLRTRSLERPFDYAVPEGMDGVSVGSVVAVELGARPVLGVVLGLSATSGHGGAVRPLAAVAELPPVPEELIGLAARLQQQYLCSLGAALTLVTPPIAALRICHDRDGAGGDRGASYTVSVTGLEEAGRALSPGGSGAPARMGRRQREALRLLESAGVVDERELRRQTGVSLRALESLLASGAVRTVESDAAAEAAARTGAAAVAHGLPELLPEQAAALEMVRSTAAGDDVLLQGVTGSGKTEVYLRAAAEVLAGGGSVLILVPEIGLTGQTIARVRARFPQQSPVVLHSGLSVGERLRAWVDTARGLSRLVVGPRSAVFAPVVRLGLIVLDEEHDDSYKQNSDPRYDARTVARWRASATGATLVSGSATPSVTTWATARRTARLTRRVDGSAPPALEIVDLRDSDAVLSPALRAGLVDCVESGSKAILFLNRRGLAGSVSCAHCGHTWMCPACDVAYGLFRRGTELRCRICGRRERAPHVCAACGSVEVGRHGVGTERLESEVSTLLPGIEALRLDSDAASSHHRLAALLRRFGEPGPRVLVGTQMVAKGHHFPDVTLVGVVNADLALYFPDYRAEERTFAMLLQVGGRAGRGRRPGRVIVQTYNPEARPITAALEGDVDGFYRDEEARRAALGYPPASTLAVLIVSAATPAPAGEAAVGLVTALRSELSAEDAVVGPSPLVRERSRYSCRIMVKTTEAGKTIDGIRRVLDAGKASWRRAGVRVIPDVEPSRV